MQVFDFTIKFGALARTMLRHYLLNFDNNLPIYPIRSRV
jgi:hypothetical protein